jgi:hypothetical protein
MYPFCETCMGLSSALHNAASRLTTASIHLHEVSGKETPDAFNAAKLEAQSLRRECEAIKAELDRHRADDHPKKAGEALGASGN